MLYMEYNPIRSSFPLRNDKFSRQSSKKISPVPLCQTDNGGKSVRLPFLPESRKNALEKSDSRRHGAEPGRLRKKRMRNQGPESEIGIRGRNQRPESEADIRDGIIRWRERRRAGRRERGKREVPPLRERAPEKKFLSPVSLFPAQDVPFPFCAGISF